MTEIQLFEIKEIQLSILDYLDDFCRIHNIKYSLACGTLLGAIRHKGFIPWDDDIDVYMLRNDYNKFINLFSSENNNLFQLYSLENNYKYNIPFAKLADKRTIIRESRNATEIGINVDIFPLDFIKEITVKKDIVYKKVRLIKKLWLIKSLKISQNRSLLKNIQLSILKGFMVFFSSRVLAEKINRLAQTYNNEESNWLFEIVDGSFYINSFSRQAFTSTILILFEGKYYQAMTGYDEYLIASFGDYMKLPPEEKRVSLHNFKAYWK